jgi:hypothetical protein
MHPTRFGSGQRDFAPLGTLFPLKDEGLAGFYRGDHCGFLALVFPQVHIAIGIIDHAALPSLLGPPEREHQAEEDEPHNLK